MLCKRIIPCLDIKDGRVVKGINFTDLRDEGDPVELAEYYDQQGADELVFLDITASVEKRDIVSKLVEKTARNVFIPFTVGGGVRTISDMKVLLKAGADKVAINSAAVKNPDLINRAATKFGSQFIVTAIDVKWDDDNWYVYIHGGRKKTDLTVIEWVKEVEKRGAGEILLTSMDGDGTREGYDNKLLKRVGEEVNIPLIASGGAGCPEHLREALSSGADAVLAASIFHEKDFSLKECKQYLWEKDVSVRRKK